jgi:hypothetical protein
MDVGGVSAADLNAWKENHNAEDGEGRKKDGGK